MFHLVVVALVALQEPKLAVQQGHAQAPVDILVTPDGKQLVTASPDGAVKLWDLATGRMLRTIAERSHQIMCAALSADGKVLALGSGDCTVRLIDVAAGTELRKLGTPPSPDDPPAAFAFVVAFSPNGRHVAGGMLDGKLRVWDTASGREAITVQADPNEVVALTMTPDGRHVVSGGVGGGIRVWELASGKPVRTLSGHTAGVFALVMTADGATLVSGSRDKTVKVWDFAKGELVRSIDGHENEVRSVAVTAKGESIVSASFDKTIRIWDSEGKELRSLAAPTEGFPRVVIAGEHVLGVVAGTAVAMWELATGKEVRTFTGGATRLDALAVSLDGKSVAVGGADRRVRVWTTAGTASIAGEHAKGIRAISFAPVGKVVIAGSEDGTIKSWDVATSKEIRAMVGHKNEVRAIDLTRDGKILASVGADKTLRFWSVATGKEARAAMALDRMPASVAISPSGRFVAAACGSFEDNAPTDGRQFSIVDALKLFDLGTGREKKLDMAESLDASAVAITSDEKRVVAVTNGGQFYAWDIATGARVGGDAGMGDEPEAPPTGGNGARCVSVSRDGRHAASGGGDGVTLWEVATGKKRQSMPAREVRAVAFDPLGAWVASAGADGSVRFWSTKDGASLGTLYAFSDGEWLFAARDGRFESSAGAGAHAGWMVGGAWEPLEKHEAKYRAKGLATKSLAR